MAADCVQFTDDLFDCGTPKNRGGVKRVFRLRIDHTTTVLSEVIIPSEELEASNAPAAERRRDAKQKTELDTDTRALLRYVGDNPGCRVGAARAIVVRDSSGRWNRAIAAVGDRLLANGRPLAELKQGAPAKLTLNPDQSEAERPWRKSPTPPGFPSQGLARLGLRPWIQTFQALQGGRLRSASQTQRQLPGTRRKPTQRSSKSLKSDACKVHVITHVNCTQSAAIGPYAG